MEALALGGNMTSPLGKADKTNSLLLQLSTFRFCLHLTYFSGDQSGLCQAVERNN